MVTNALEHNHNWFETNAKDDWNDDIAAVYEAATYALLKNQDQADALIKQFHLANGEASLAAGGSRLRRRLGPRRAVHLSALACNFPERLKTLTQDDLMTLAYPIINYDFNTVSSAEAILALDAYGRAMKAELSLERAWRSISSLEARARKLDLSGGLYPEATFDRDADALVFKKSRRRKRPAARPLLPDQRKRF